MNDETLLDIAMSNYRNALKVYKYANDERDLNHTGYLLQQASELCIKHCMEMSGIRYQHTHVIEDLLDNCEDSVTFSDDFYNFAPAISRWEANSRYVKGFRLAARQIEQGFSLVKELLLANGASDGDLKLVISTTRNIDVF